jgi:hypothetical protein
MKESPRADAPEPVEKLWSTIEAYCEDRTGQRRPVRHIARRTGLSRSTVSDWFNYRSFPQWEAFSQFLTYVEDEAWRHDLTIMWQAAWDAHQAARVTAGPVAPKATPASDSPRRRRRRALIAVGALLLVLATTAFVVVQLVRSDATDQQADSTAPAVGIVGGACMTVSAQDVRVFTSATADEVWTTWVHGTKFWVDHDAGSANRYRTVLRNGRHGWVTNDRRYIQPSTGCA